MPTYGRFAQFDREFVTDLRAGQGFRKGVENQAGAGNRDVWELTWAPDGRATWQYGPEQIAGEPHVMWRRIGTHSIFRNP